MQGGTYYVGCVRNKDIGDQMNFYTSDDILASFIFVRCPKCKRKRPRDWSVTLLTKWPATAELTDEQRSTMDAIIAGYLNDIWTMCRDHRRTTDVSSYRLNGEPKLNPSDYPAILKHRMQHNWSAHISSTRPDRTGVSKRTVELEPGRTDGWAH
jgi:hypothetical protein